MESGFWRTDGKVFLVVAPVAFDSLFSSSICADQSSQRILYIVDAVVA